MPTVTEQNMVQVVGTSNIATHNDNKPDSATANKMSNAVKSTAAGEETATMTLRGYPRLKAKATVEVTGVGKGSGKWYCKTVVQQWNVDHGYLTNALLIKGGGGDSSGGKPGGDQAINANN
jgi:phage protein D